MTIDTSEVAFREGEIDNYVPIHFVLSGNGNKVYATGGGCVYFNGYNHVFHNATIIATNETTIVVQGYASQASPVTIAPGSALRFLKAVQPYKTLTLGTTGATTPTKLGFNHADGFALTTNQFTATKLVVNSPVSVAWCTNGWKGAAICPNGTYTGLVYTVAGSTVAASDFVLPAQYEGYKTLTTELLDYSGTQKAVVFTIAGTEPPEPEPPAPVPETFDTLTVRTGEQVTISDGATVKNLTIEGGSWATPSVTGSFTVSDMLQLGADGTIASAALNGDFTIGSNCVWRIDFDNALLNYDLLVVDGNLTIQPGVTIDFGRVVPNRVPQKYSLPIAKYTGICSAPASVKVINAGAVLQPAKLYLTPSDGVLYASPVPGAMVITIR